MKKVVWLTLLLVALIPTISLACEPPESTTTCGGCSGNKDRTVIVSFTTVGVCQFQPQFSFGNCGNCAI
jgi:hypothetical protein